jgi:hypothetical protein
MLRKFGIIAVLSLLALALAAVPALAVTTFNSNTAPSGAHYRQGSSEPVCTPSTDPNTGALTVSCTGTTIGGVGNTPANLLLTINADANFTCSNPGSKRMVVEPHSGAVGETDQATLTPSRNGQLIVDARSVTLTPQEAGAQFECPNENWRENFVGFSDPTFSYSLTFVGFNQPAILITG